ncbi:Uncharacterised protein [Legionella beliardensis]|uniref:Uncharacterized protein n=1 Tax=Legionella beliardensis TaxID=91822 RepID=A0A378I192_9GAMM|nr:hypothetical protein [Legionella beliardensis]STX28919.1 Uncharacterised protein [Legionella beliardensis]
MKTIFSKLINKFTLGLYIALANSVAFAGGPGMSWSPGWIAGGVLAAAVIGGIIAFVGNDDDDDEANVLVCQ